jgi:hypothetical protein
MGVPYIRAFKTGKWPVLDHDALYLWSRPHPQDMDIPEDVLGKPLGWNYVRYCSLISQLNMILTLDTTDV